MSETPTDGGERVPPLNLTRREFEVLHAQWSSEVDKSGEWSDSKDGEAVESLWNKLERINWSLDSDDTASTGVGHGGDDA